MLGKAGLIAVALLAAHALAQAPPKEMHLEQAPTEAKPEAKPHWLMIVFTRPSACQEIVQRSRCDNMPPHETALCLTQPNIKLSPECENELTEGALAHGDLEVLHRISLKHALSTTATAKDTKLAEQAPGRPVHPIVAQLRHSCATEFQKNICGFALNARVCPRKLLHCLVQNRASLGPQCTMATRAEITMMIQREQTDPIRFLCSLFAWVLAFLALVLCSLCCCKMIARCCCKSRPAPARPAPAPAAGLTTGDPELEMALIISAAQVGCPGKVASGIPVIQSSADQV